MENNNNPENDEDTVNFDPIKLGNVLVDVMERAQPILQEAAKKYSKELAQQPIDPMNLSEAYLEFINALASDPNRLVELQMEYWNNWIDLWQETAFKFVGEPAQDLYKPEKGDRRFRSDMWQESALFDFIKQSYLMTSRWMQKVVHSTEGLDKETQDKIDFYTRQFADALAPTNFVLTNPDVLKETIESGGENLVRGLENLIEDLERGKGELKISTTDYSAFELGKNIAITPGQVVYQNDLIQLIQYTPSTDKAFKTPLLVIPPWINKYYILDLRPKNSFMKWLVDQGHTVFCISWVNPAPDHADKGFEDYMLEGIIESLDQIAEITGEKQCNAIGYCLGGTLLSATLSYLKTKKQNDRIKSATFLTTLIDFEDAGELKLFTDDRQIALMDQDMEEKGLLEAKDIQQTFSILRSNDLIWSFVINNYLMGREPFPFDLLYWNDDSTNMPAKMHSFYLRNMYLDNVFVKPGGVTLDSTPIDVRTIDTPCYFLSTREDHIAPWRATYKTTQLVSGDKTFTLAASGHIAGVINPPESGKYCYWTSAETPDDPELWLQDAKEEPGSWWPHWNDWAKKYAGKKVEARKPKDNLEPAPGSFVKVRST